MSVHVQGEGRGEKREEDLREAVGVKFRPLPSV